MACKETIGGSRHPGHLTFTHCKTRTSKVCLGSSSDSGLLSWITCTFKTSSLCVREAKGTSTSLLKCNDNPSAVPFPRRFKRAAKAQTTLHGKRACPTAQVYGHDPKFCTWVSFACAVFRPAIGTYQAPRGCSRKFGPLATIPYHYRCFGWVGNFPPSAHQCYENPNQISH